MLLPDVMGWFAWLPGMECRHGVVALAGKTTGSLRIRNELVELGGGDVYVEKDWGYAGTSTLFWNHCIHIARLVCLPTRAV